MAMCLWHSAHNPQVTYLLKDSADRWLDLEAQQRNSSYRVILVAMVLQNVLVLVFMGGGSRTSIARYLANWVSHGCVCVNEVARGGIAPFWGAANLPEKVSRDMRYRSGYYYSIAVSRDMGPLSGWRCPDFLQLEGLKRNRAPPRFHLCPNI